MANLGWLDLYSAMFPAGPPRRAYQNFPDPQLPDWQRAYYAANPPRLVEVKHAYDPGGFFWYEQGIGSGGRSGWRD